MASEGGAGRQLLLVLVLLALVGGAGAWNYDRNLKAEEALPRPWKGYSDADLQSMADAYRQEVEQYSKRWNTARGERTQARDRGLVGDAAREFERVQERGRRVRELKSEMAERQVALEEIQEEMGLREKLGAGWELHWRRLTSLEPVS